MRQKYRKRRPVVSCGEHLAGDKQLPLELGGRRVKRSGFPGGHVVPQDGRRIEMRLKVDEQVFVFGPPGHLSDRTHRWKFDVVHKRAVEGENRQT